MAESGNETRMIAGREVILRWRKANYGEWLAWAYLPGDQQLHNQGVGFEARAKNAKAALNEVARQIRKHLKSSD